MTTTKNEVSGGGMNVTSRGRSLPGGNISRWGEWEQIFGCWGWTPPPPTGFPIGGHWGCPPFLQFFSTLPIKSGASMAMGHPSPLENEASPIGKWSPLQGNDSWKRIPKKLETFINTWASIIKQHWKKMAEIPQISGDCVTCNIQNLIRKVKQLARKYYITWIITQLVEINIAPLTMLFCDCPLFSNFPLADL